MKKPLFILPLPTTLQKGKGHSSLQPCDRYGLMAFTATRRREGAYAALICHSTDPSGSPPCFATTGAIDRCTSSTFEKLVALIRSLQWITEHSGGCLVSCLLRQSLFSALQYVVNNYYKATGSHVKVILVESYVLSARRSSINLIHIPRSQGSNETRRPTERLPKPCDMLSWRGIFRAAWVRACSTSSSPASRFSNVPHTWTRRRDPRASMGMSPTFFSLISGLHHQLSCR